MYCWGLFVPASHIWWNGFEPWRQTNTNQWKIGEVYILCWLKTVDSIYRQIKHLLHGAPTEARETKFTVTVNETFESKQYHWTGTAATSSAPPPHLLQLSVLTLDWLLNTPASNFGEFCRVWLSRGTWNTCRQPLREDGEVMGLKEPFAVTKVLLDL